MLKLNQSLRQTDIHADLVDSKPEFKCFKEIALSQTENDEGLQVITGGENRDLAFCMSSLSLLDLLSLIPSVFYL